MNLNKIIRWTLCIAIGIMFLVANVYLVFTPIREDIKALDKKYQDNYEKIRDLREIKKAKQQFEERKNSLKYLLGELTDRLPNAVVPEKFVILLKEYASEREINLSGISFLDPVEFDCKEIKEKCEYEEASNKEKKEANKQITNFFTKADKKDKEVDKRILQYSHIKDESPFKVAVNFGFNGSYSNVKKFIRDLENCKNKVEIKSLEIGVAEDTSTLNGNMSIIFYGLKDSKIPVYDLWNPEINNGKNNIFSTAGSSRYDVDDSNVCDFIIRLNSYEDDIPSVVLNEHGNYNSVLLANNSGVENVKLYLNKSNGRYLYRYQTQELEHPVANKYEEFNPSTSSDIIVKVFSEKRIDKEDVAGINLTVYNNTDRKVNVVSYNDDEKNPRLKYTVVN